MQKTNILRLLPYILVLLGNKAFCNIFNTSSISINVVEGRSSDLELVIKNPADHSATPEVQIIEKIFSPYIMKQQKPPADDEQYEHMLGEFSEMENYDDEDHDEEQNQRINPEGTPKGPGSRTKGIPGRLIIKYKEKVLSKAVKELRVAGIMSKNGQYPKLDGVAFLTRVVSALSESADELVGIKSATVLEALDMMIVEVFNNSKASEYISKLSASLLHSDEVEYVEPDQEVRLADFGISSDSGAVYPNDPKFGEQWGMYNRVANTDSKVLMAWKHLGINTSAPKGPEGYYTSENQPKREVIVAVIDTGVDFTHPDLVDNMWINEKELYGRPGVDDDMNGYVDDIYGYDFANNRGAPVDDEGHGTHCAGTIAAKGNNYEGISGINWKGVKIMALKFLRGNGIGFLSDSVKAINYAIKMGANILSNSWGGGSFSQATYDAIKRSIDKNMLFVVAAGNDRNNNDIRPTYPSAYQLPNVLSVAAIDIHGRLGVFSNYGHRSVDMAAPGVDILSTSSNKGYKRLSGTSMACPFVSGAAALLYAFDPSMTFDQAKTLILKSVTVLPTLRNSVRTSGTLNIYRAVQIMSQEAYNQENGKESPRMGISWITFKAPDTIGPQSSSTLKLKAYGEKPGSFTSTLVVKLLDSNDRDVTLAQGRLKTIINVVSIPKPKAILPNGNSTNLGLSFMGLEGTKTLIPISNSGIGTLEYMAEFVNMEGELGSKKKGKFKVYPPLGTILTVGEDQTNKDLQVSCIPNSLEGFISGHLMLRYNKGGMSSSSSSTNKISAKSTKIPYVRSNLFTETSSIINTLSSNIIPPNGNYASLSSSSFPVGTERLAIKLYCKGYGIEVRPPSINRVIRIPETTISGYLIFKGLENSFKPKVYLRFKSLRDPSSSRFERENNKKDYLRNIIPIKDLSPSKSYFKMILSGEDLPAKKRIIHRLEGMDSEEGKTKIVVSLDDVIIPKSNVKFEWVDFGLHQETILTDLSNSDDGVQKVNLPRSWHFLGERIDEIYVSVNGFISFSPIYSEAFVPALPSYAPPHGILAPLWTDFTTKGRRKSTRIVTFFKTGEDEDFGSRDKYRREMDMEEQEEDEEENGERRKQNWEFVIEWRNVFLKSEQYNSKSATFQCVLNSNGSVRFNYLSIPWDDLEDPGSISSSGKGNLAISRISSSTMLGWESIDGVRGVGIPCTEKFPTSESSIELYPENPKIPWFQLSETIVPPLQRAQMVYKVGWKATIPSFFEDQTFKGQIQVSSSDGAASIIPVSITAIKERTNQAQSSEELEGEYIGISGESGGSEMEKVGRLDS
ncbi:subtilisin-like serine protease [Cryptosporidium ubiquitum]|uniref:subtilisin n=1 Tax=Cryptosporidium ubiquitum TaxID=857276 RepID=A0A1J4MGL9_9CRYT|nr:subtilisin-like serine protease [Cryptosporidium ubiquitum]OII73402.1 subtilisin-like serine protease [Cryptosporidium ubiquitum]